MAFNRFWFWYSTIALLLHATTLATDCPESPTLLHLSDGPYENYFYSDCDSSSHIIVTSPLPNSNLDLIGPRLLVAWPAGNSGIVSIFESQNGQRGTLGIHLGDSSSVETVAPIYDEGKPYPEVGVTSSITFNNSATLTVPILGSIRIIRDYTEGGRYLHPNLQAANQFSITTDGGATINRTWLDGATTTWLTFTPMNGSDPIRINRDNSPVLLFGAGTYSFSASFNYPQLKRLSPKQVLNQASIGLIDAQPDETNSLSFLAYSDKLLAGAWRFLTYFGRDSMISLLLLQPVLSDGQGGAIEAVIGSVLERINKNDGSACHEEVIGDFATYMNIQDHNLVSDSPTCDYKMIDTDYYLPVVMKNYLVDTEAGKNRVSDFLKTTASFLADNKGLTYEALAQITAEKIMQTSAPFAAPGGQTKANLIHLKDNQSVGEWRDSGNGIGGGRIPYDVNTALVPAALRAIAALSRAGFFTDHPEWATVADTYADVWEDYTLQFFEVVIPQTGAVSLVKDYVNQSKFPGPSQTETIQSDIKFYGLALDGGNDQPVVRVMNTDDCFRHFLLETSNQTQLSSFLSQTADNILQPFPVGLSSSVGLFVANPAYGGDPSYAQGFTRTDYHGTVVWSWQLAMMGAGLARQLRRCEADGVPVFCHDESLYRKIVAAYNHLWDLIDANKDQLGGEVWTWTYNNGFQAAPLGDFTASESDIRQLWSLTFLAIQRETFKQYRLNGSTT
ncbi:hypothetical protein K505DRAFT_361297 [Melanomma pulvis-pyrius CBS 109.77]|uniref:Glycogen debranching enzyme n=1 Tax=Melanomma pulvis-pyrius CBS 109.77 TaxID=1314802 RepID=A0A6A6XDJ4_9PLEO|nr:hypothetical protein K505DRAFT_361297 [Melanomma pulvis-pyrius CBS 109.77]